MSTDLNENDGTFPQPETQVEATQVQSREIQVEATQVQSRETQVEEIRKKDKIVNDAIFGFITLWPYIVSLINTVEFQRLRRICHLGFVPFVYPTADHSRFEHSIGTYHLASKLVRKLKNQLEAEQCRTIIDDKDVICVEVAALFHDIGCGPFSDFWDKILLPEIFGENKYEKPEDHFRVIWEKKIKLLLKDENLNVEHEKLICYLIDGKKYEEKEYREKEILREIVRNASSGIDVDVWDHLARDATNLGHSSTNYRIEIERMIHFARAIKDKDGKWKVAFRISEEQNMLGVFYMRHYMYKTAYKHRTVVSIEQMVVDGFKRYIKENHDFKEKISTSDWILKNDDSIFWSNVTVIPEFQRVVERNLYRPIFEAVIYKIKKNPSKEIIDFLKKKGVATTIDPINSKQEMSDYRFGFRQIELCKTDPIPMLSVPFYKNSNPQEIFKYENGSLPSHLNYDVDESRLTIFSMTSNEHDDVRNYLEEFFEEKNKKLLNKRATIKEPSKRKDVWTFEKIFKDN